MNGNFFAASFDQAFFEQGLRASRPSPIAPVPYLTTPSPARVAARQVQPLFHRSGSRILCQATCGLP